MSLFDALSKVQRRAIAAVNAVEHELSGQSGIDRRAAAVKKVTDSLDLAQDLATVAEQTGMSIVEATNKIVQTAHAGIREANGVDAFGPGAEKAKPAEDDPAIPDD